MVVQERAGNANKALTKSEPLKDEKCGWNDCFLCETGMESVRKTVPDMKLCV